MRMTKYENYHAFFDFISRKRPYSPNGEKFKWRVEYDARRQLIMECRKTGHKMDVKHHNGKVFAMMQRMSPTGYKVTGFTTIEAPMHVFKFIKRDIVANFTQGV